MGVQTWISVDVNVAVRRMKVCRVQLFIYSCIVYQADRREPPHLEVHVDRPASLYRHAGACAVEVIPPKSGILCEVSIATKAVKAGTT